LFVSVGGGLIRTYDSHGTQTGELETQTNSDEICDMCFGDGVIRTGGSARTRVLVLNGGDRWSRLPGALPPILSVSTVVL
jgi:hypothetical protein